MLSVDLEGMADKVEQLFSSMKTFSNEKATNLGEIIPQDYQDIVPGDTTQKGYIVGGVSLILLTAAVVGWTRSKKRDGEALSRTNILIQKGVHESF